MICAACAAWMGPVIDADAGTARCPACGHAEPVTIAPLFIVTGTSATGKTAVIPALRPLLPDWEVFETDILWDSGGDWHFVRSNWLRIAHGIAMNGRPTILCGTHLPENIDPCDHRGFFRPVYYLALHCDDATRAARLRARRRGAAARKTSSTRSGGSPTGSSPTAKRRSTRRSRSSTPRTRPSRRRPRPSPTGHGRTWRTGSGNAGPLGPEGQGSSRSIREPQGP
jgi:hypothetical protein